jgi:hypothetical protein
MKTAIVVTSINDGAILRAYADNIIRHGREADVRIYAIPDLKTPAGFARTCAKLRRRGLMIECPDVPAQDDFMRKICLPVGVVPYNSDNRRNIGYLMALEAGAATMISIDDDNYCLQKSDFVGEHLLALGKRKGIIHECTGGWFNICTLLEIEPTSTMYPRGFPYFSRGSSSVLSCRQGVADVGINAGLWLGDPDVDAISWLAIKPRAIAFTKESIMLGSGTWTPVNTQNTALTRAMVPAFYYIRMGYPVGGLTIDRYGDIMAGYFAQACVAHLGKIVRVGTPLVQHVRNRHDYFIDLQQELSAILVMEEVLPWLRQLKLQGRAAVETYDSLSAHLDDAAETFRGRMWNRSSRGFLHDTAYCMRQWIAACRRVL